LIDSDVYRSGRYVEHFRPDDPRNPFHRLYAEKHADVVARLGALGAEGALLLDLGGGPGRMAVPLAARRQVVLADISADMLRTAASAAAEAGAPERHLALVQLDAGRPLPFPPSSFDGIACIDLLSHVQQPRVMLDEVRRVLKGSGQLLIDASNRTPWWLLRYPRSVGRRPSAFIPALTSGGIPREWRGLIKHYTHTEFAAMLRAAGFRVTEELRYGPSWCPKWFLAVARPGSSA
jgi:ubiquinone/menaquinone biosynthesis C-methylase UbiE